MIHVINFTTPDYAAILDHYLARSVRELDDTRVVLHHTEKPSAGTWSETLGWKPTHILEELDRIGDDVVWCDADQRLEQAPDYVLMRAGSKFDFAMRDRVVGAWHCGLIHVRNTPRARETLKRWAEACRANPETRLGDQTHFAAVAEATGAEIAKLPTSYVWIRYGDPGDKPPPGCVVSCYQASAWTRLRKTADPERRLPFPVDNDSPTVVIGKGVRRIGMHVVNFATTDYAAIRAEHLERSVASLPRGTVRLHTVTVPHGGTWAQACGMKPAIMLEYLERLAAPFAWCDADQRIERDPDLFADHPHIAGDFVARHGCAWSSPCTGLIYVRPTAAARRALERWATLCAEEPSGNGDQPHFARACSDAGATIGELPRGWLWIQGIDGDAPPDDAVVTAWQASRQMRQKAPAIGPAPTNTAAIRAHVQRRSGCRSCFGRDDVSSIL